MLSILRIIFYVGCVAAAALFFMDAAAEAPTPVLAGLWPLLAMVFSMVSDMQDDLLDQYKDIVKRLRETRNVKL